MPIDVTIRIHSDEEGQISELEKNILASLSGGQTVGSTAYHVSLPEGATAESLAGNVEHASISNIDVSNLTAPTKEAEKPAEAPKRKRRTKAEIEADEAAKAAEAETPKADEDTAPSSESEDAAPVVEEPSTEPAGEPTGEAGKTGEDLVQEAVARAAKFMRDGRGPEAKAALDRVGNGAERVSKLNPKDVPAYMAALDELESL